MIRLKNCGCELGRLLGIKIIKGEDFYDHALGQRFRLAMNDQNVLNEISFLIQDLQVIENYKPEILKKFREKIKNKPQTEYFGWRFEVKIAASFCNKSIQYTYDDRPDFIIGNNICFVECTGASFNEFKIREGLTQEDIENKIKDLKDNIGKKSTAYGNRNTALFIEINELLSAAIRVGIQPENIILDINTFVHNEQFGSIVLLWYTDECNEHRYRRHDSFFIDKDLQVFLNEFYSKRQKA